MTGSLSVLNVGAGDIEIVFNQHNQDEVDKALRMLNDMQKRGYAILIRLDDGSYTRVTEIDATRGRYIVQLPDGSTLAGSTDEPKKRGRPRKSVSVTKAHATGVARSAGG